MKRIIPVYIFQQVNVLLVSLYLLKLLCIGELTILQILYCASLISFLWMYGQRKQAHKIDMKSRMKWLGIDSCSRKHESSKLNWASTSSSLVFIFIVLNQCEYD